MIALDAADVRLVERWMDDGSLPTLAKLKAQGAFGRLDGLAEVMSGATWPTFYTGELPTAHGRYSYLQWRAQRMAFERPREEWIPARPFWREIADRRCKVLVVDPPSTYSPSPIEGIEIVGYAAHDRLHPPTSYPGDALRRLEREFGVAPLGPEAYSSSGDLRLTNALLDSTERLAAVSETLLRREPWSFALVCLTATHRAGHRLWHAPSGDGDDGVGPSDALKRVYVACDAAVGRLVDAAGAGTSCIVFALHGMQENTSRLAILDAMLERVLGAAPRRTRRPLAVPLLDMVPVAVRSRVKSRLPLPLQDRLSNHRATSGIDWQSRKAFTLISDLPGYIRLNVRGREARGIVEDSGRERQELVQRIREGLASFVDSVTGQPVVDRVVVVPEVFGRGPAEHLLPDLSVRWSSTAPGYGAVESPEYGVVEWPTAGGQPTGRSGNHRNDGFMLGVGRRFAPGAVIGGARTLDLRPTALALLGIEDRVRRPGRSLVS